MQNKKGFTLVELLVAATILGILVFLATTEYRNGVAEARWAQAKLSADQLATAVLQAKMDYPTLTFTGNLMRNVVSNCNYSLGMPEDEPEDPASLIACNYLEKQSWSNENFVYLVCDQNGTCPSFTDNPIACVKVNEKTKMSAKYKTYAYCVDAQIGGVENLNNN